jgi:hypothetical protein
MNNILPKGIGVWTVRFPDLGATPEAVADKAAATGLGHVACKNADGRIERDHTVLSHLGALLRARGVEFWVWPYAGYKRPADADECAQEGRLHAQFAQSVGATGVISDIETDDTPGSYAYSGTNAAAYMDGFRAAAPGMPHGVTSYWHRGYHPSMPWQALLERGFNAPQVYWTIARMSPSAILMRSLASFGSLGMPAYPLGGDAQVVGLGDAAIQEFANACAAVNPPLTSWGLYHWAGQIDWTTLHTLCRRDPLPSLSVVGPDGLIDCQPAVTADGRLWVNLGAVLPVLLGTALTFAGGDAEHPSRTKLRELAAACGWKVDVSHWPETVIYK